MFQDRLTRDLYLEIRKIRLIDPHSHIDPHNPTSKSLEDILGYHYYTELAHSAGMSKDELDPSRLPLERVHSVMSFMDRYANTAQYGWFVDIARTFLNHKSDQVTRDDANALFQQAEATFNEADWENQVFEKSNLEKIFLTNEFDDNLTGFDSNRYVPCLRTDTLVFKLTNRDVRTRLANVTGVEVGDWESVQQAMDKLFQHFVQHGARACAISLPPTFSPTSVSSAQLSEDDAEQLSHAVFWLIAEKCREYKLPFDLMIGVNRSVYRDGVHQGQDLFDQRTSLIQYADLFNAFPEVTFPISVLSSGQNQELVSYSWIFPNVVTNGHWWYSNIPFYIAGDCQARLQAVPHTKQIGYYSDAYKLEFVYPKFDMYRKILARILADHFVRDGVMSEEGAINLAKGLLRENVQKIFGV